MSRFDPQIKMIQSILSDLLAGNPNAYVDAMLQDQLIAASDLSLEQAKMNVQNQLQDRLLFFKDLAAR